MYYPLRGNSAGWFYMYFMVQMVQNDVIGIWMLVA